MAFLDSREFHFHLFTEAAPLKHLLLSTSLYSNDFSPNLRCQDSDRSPEKGEGLAISSLTSEEAGLPRLQWHDNIVTDSHYMSLLGFSLMNFTHSIIARLPSTTILYKSCSPGSWTVERSFAKKVVRSWPSSTRGSSTSISSLRRHHWSICCSLHLFTLTISHPIYAVRIQIALLRKGKVLLFPLWPRKRLVCRDCNDMTT